MSRQSGNNSLELGELPSSSFWCRYSDTVQLLQHRSLREPSCLHTIEYRAKLGSKIICGLLTLLNVRT